MPPDPFSPSLPPPCEVPGRTPPEVCVVGLGSLAGDDQAGWRLIERLAQRQAAGELPAGRIRLVRLGPPAEVLNLLPVRRRLIVVDACRGAIAPGQWARFGWPAPHLAQTTLGHNLPLVATLELAEALGLLPPQCELWCVGGSDFCPEAHLAPAVEEAVGRMAELLAAELQAER